MGASAMRTSAEQLLGARPRAPPLPHHHHHHHHHHVHQHRHVNYSDFERSHFDPASIKPPPRVPNNTSVSGEEVGYETVPEVPPANDHEGYERVEDYWRGKNHTERFEKPRKKNQFFEKKNFNFTKKKF